MPALSNLKSSAWLRTRPDTMHAAAIYAAAYETLFFPAWQRFVRRRPIGTHLRRLERTQWYDAESLDRLQIEALRRLLVHAGQQVPYWRDLFRRIHFDPRAVTRREHLAELPVLDRETVRERQAELIDPALAPSNIRRATSGATGVPLPFQYCSQSDAWRRAVRLRGYAWAGYRMGQRTVHYWGEAARAARGWAARKAWVDGVLRRASYLDAVAEDEASLWSAADRLARVRPHCVIGRTRALANFARWAIDRGARDWPDARVICAADALEPQDRSAIESAFGPAVFEMYESREAMLIAAECAAHHGMHISEENLLVEIARDGDPVPPGERGDVLVTDLHNYGMPFIRYANGDAAAIAPEQTCPCGRALRRIARV